MFLMDLFKRQRDRIWWRKVHPQLGACGERVRLPSCGDYVYSSLFFGSNIMIGRRSIMWAGGALGSRIVIGDNVVMGPEVVIMSGNHHTGLIGKYIIDIGESEKSPEDDRDVIFEGDNWVGARAIILKGVTIGRGAVIGAGSVVTRSIPPYSIAAGNPARPIKMRGTVEEILAQEQKLYPSEKRLSREALEEAVLKVEKARQRSAIAPVTKSTQA